MQAGKMRDRVTLLSRGQNRNAAGGIEDAWHEHAKAWAYVRFFGPKERIEAGSIDPDIVADVHMHFRNDLDSSMAILAQGQVLEIVGPPINVQSRSRTVRLNTRLAANQTVQLAGPTFGVSFDEAFA